jgi:hypothetical protein
MDIATTCFAKKGEFVARVIGGETIIVPVRGQVGDLESVYNLNEVGSLIWERVDGKTPVSGIVEAVAREFEVTAEDAEKDTLEFLGGLESAGLIAAG